MKSNILVVTVLASILASIESALFVSGPLEGLTCDAEAVQSANSAQLHSILSELANTTFFRLVRVVDDSYCPIESLREKVPEDTCGAPPDDGFGGSSVGDWLTMPPTGSPPGGASLCSIEVDVSPQEIAGQVVTSISAEEDSARNEFPLDNDCVITGTSEIRPDYWLDLCGGASPTLPSEYVNLRLNPERNTGYNGSVVWDAMHGAVSGMDSPEGIIMQRLLSGYHASVSTQIMWSYFPPKDKSSASDSKWRPNVEKFATHVFEREQEGIRNMQFAFVVLARALFKIKEYLYAFKYTTGNVETDLATQRLMEHLLDSSVLSVCDQVFSAFDESVMFSRAEKRERGAPEFKKTYRKISGMANCVGCHRCKLHARVAMHGIGVGIKILLTPTQALVTESLSRDDIVALVNTLQKFSESIHLSNEMMSSYYASRLDVGVVGTSSSQSVQERELEFVAVNGLGLTKLERDSLVHALVRKDSEIMLLGKYFSGYRFVRHALIALQVQASDMLVVGGGLAGLVTAISMADRGGSVVLLDKGFSLGGNSAKASSGINSWTDEADIPLFERDTLKSQNGLGNARLAEILVRNANESVAWLEKIINIPLSEVGQMGGHSIPRTHRPTLGVVGAEIMAALVREARKRYPLLKVVTKANVVELVVGGEDNRIVEGVVYVSGDGVKHTVFARSVVIASGGFGFDASGMMKSYRPDLERFPTTLGAHTTGDGIRLAASLGADLVDMDQVQLHPTGFVDPADREAHTKVLAAEILRGIGGILVDRNGKRFVNELGTRKHVTDTILMGSKSNNPFFLVLSANAAAGDERLTSIYEARGLLKRVASLEELAQIVGDGIKEEVATYSKGGSDDDDAFGRTSKNGLPFDLSEFWLVGEVTPVVHYTMGGIKIDHKGRVLKNDGSVIPNLFAVGEVSGGVHGENRLGGNSLLECTVFGRIIGGESVPLIEELSGMHFPEMLAREQKTEGKSPVLLLSIEQVKAHNSEADCWTVIQGNVYDLSNYAEEHPGGIGAIRESCGIDSTERFLRAHSPSLLQDMEFSPIGRIEL